MRTAQRFALILSTLLIALGATATTALADPPGNDDFANAVELTASSPLPGGTTEATVEDGEYTASETDSPADTTWYKFTAPSKGRLVVTTCAFDDNLATSLFTGELLIGLTPIGFGYGSGCVSVMVMVDSSQTAWIQISATAPGVDSNYSVEAAFVATPANDDFADATQIEGNSFSTTVDNTAATNESGEPSLSGDTWHSVWFKYTAPADGRLDVASCKFMGIDVVLSVYTGSDLEALTSGQTSSNECDFPGTGGHHNIAVTAGTTYMIQLASSSAGVSGELNFDLSFAPKPANDDFAAAVDIDPNDTVAGTSAGAGTEDGEVTSDPMYSPYHTVWYRLVAPTAGNIQASLCSTDGGYDATVSIFKGNSFDSLTPLKFNDDTCGLLSQASANVDAGETVYIAVGGYYKFNFGDFTLDTSFVPLPANDNLADAQVLTGDKLTQASSNRGSTSELMESLNDPYPADDTVWFSWTAPSDGVLDLDTCSEGAVSFGTSFAVYTGAGYGELTDIAYPQTGCPLFGVKSRFSVTADTTYLIQVGSTQAGMTSSFSLNLELHTTSANDDFADAEDLGSQENFSVAGDNLLATNEGAEPDIGVPDRANSVWYKWTAPYTGYAWMSTCADGEVSRDGVLAVYLDNNDPAALETLIPVGIAKDGCDTGSMGQMTISIAEGTTYWISVGSEAPTVGWDFELSILGRPTVTTAPSITGDAEDGETLTANPGDWVGAQDPSFNYDWRRCNADGDECVSTGATGTEYTVGPDDFNHTIRVDVEAVNDYGHSFATTDATAVVPDETPPNDMFANAIDLGSAYNTEVEGSTRYASVEAGEPQLLSFPPRTLSVWYKWTAPADGDYRISLCEESGVANVVGVWVTIQGEEPGIETLGSTDLGVGVGCGEDVNRFRFDNNVTGGMTYWFQVSPYWDSGTPFDFELSIASAPHNTALPTVSGDPVVGEQLSASGTGSWEGESDINYSVAWERCSADESTCAPIDGANSVNYTLTEDDYGSKLRFVVSANNDLGTRNIVTPFTAVIDKDTDGDGVADGDDTCPSVAGTKENGCNPELFAPGAPPTISGPATTVGTTITGAEGTVNVTETDPSVDLDTPSHGWQRCTDSEAPESCSDIAGQTGSTYVLKAADLGKWIRFTVHYSNGDYETTVGSGSFGPVTAAAVPPADPPAAPSIPLSLPTLPKSLGSVRASSLKWPKHTIVCGTAPCAITIELSTKIKRKKVVLGSLTLNLGAGETAPLQAKLSGSGKSLLKKLKKKAKKGRAKPISVTLTLKGSAANSPSPTSISGFKLKF